MESAHALCIRREHGPRCVRKKRPTALAERREALHLRDKASWAGVPMLKQIHDARGPLLLDGACKAAPPALVPQDRCASCGFDLGGDALRMACIASADPLRGSTRAATILANGRESTRQRQLAAPRPLHGCAHDTACPRCLECTSCKAKGLATMRCEHCLEIIFTADLDQHRAQYCSMRAVHKTVACTLCGKDVSQLALAHHIGAECLKRPVTCDACGDDMLAEELQLHRDERCPRRSVECPNGCLAELQAFELESHIERLCPRRKIVCRWCTVWLEAANWTAHETACPSRPCHCGWCGAAVPNVELQQHQASSCPRRFVV